VSITFRVAADPANRAAAFVLDNSAALRAGASVEGRRLDQIGVAGQRQVRLDRFGNCVGAGEHLVIPEAGRGVAGNAQKLLHNGSPLNAASPGQGDHASDRLALRSRATAGLAHGGKDFEETGVVLVDGDVERTAAGLHLVGPALERLGTLALDGALVLDMDRRSGQDGLFLLAPGGEHLLVARAITVDGYTFQVGLVGETVHLLDIFHGGFVREVDGLADRVVRVALEGRLHRDVHLGGDVVGGDEDVPDILGDRADAVNGAVLSDALHELLGVKPLGLGDLFEKRVHLDQDVLVHYLAHVGDREERLDAAGGVGDDGDGSGRRDGGHRGVTDRLGARPVVDGALEVREGAARLGQGAGGRVPLVVDELHHLLAQRGRFGGVVRDAKHDQHVGPAHDAQTDFAVGAGHLVDLLQRVVVHLDDVVQEVDRELHDFLQPVPVHFSLCHELAQVDGAEVAGLVRQ